MLFSELLLNYVYWGNTREILIGDSKDIDEEAAKEWEHKVLQNTMDKELIELNKRLQQKEVW